MSVRLRHVWPPSRRRTNPGTVRITQVGPGSASTLTITARLRQAAACCQPLLQPLSGVVAVEQLAGEQLALEFGRQECLKFAGGRQGGWHLSQHPGLNSSDRRKHTVSQHQHVITIVIKTMPSIGGLEIAKEHELSTDMLETNRNDNL